MAVVVRLRVRSGDRDSSASARRRSAPSGRKPAQPRAPPPRCVSALRCSTRCGAGALLTARRACSQVVSLLGSIELTADVSSWPALVPSLVQGALQAHGTTRLCTLEALGYLCEELVRAVVVAIAPPSPR